MPVYTTYLARLKNDPKMPERIGSCFVYHIAIARAPKENRCVAPDWSFLNQYKKDTDCDNCSAREARDPNTCDPCHEEAWIKYEKTYLNKIQSRPEAREWIQKRSADAILGNILLVCYEKDSTHCHRRLLAEEIARFTGLNGKHAEYRGEFLD